MSRDNLAFAEIDVNDAQNIAAVKPGNSLCLADLSHESQSRAWEFIRLNRPAVAITIEETIRNPAVQQLMYDFDATISVDKTIFPREFAAAL